MAYLSCSEYRISWFMKKFMFLGYIEMLVLLKEKFSFHVSVAIIIIRRFELQEGEFP